MAVFCSINTFRTGSQKTDAGLMKLQRKIIGSLAPNRNNNSFRIFKFIEVEHSFKGNFFKIQLVADIIIRADGFRIAVQHEGSVAEFSYGLHRSHTAPVKFHTASNAIGTASQYQN